MKLEPFSAQEDWGESVKEAMLDIARQMETISDLKDLVKAFTKLSSYIGILPQLNQEKEIPFWFKEIWTCLVDALKQLNERNFELGEDSALTFQDLLEKIYFSRLKYDLKTQINQFIISPVREELEDIPGAGHYSDDKP